MRVRAKTVTKTISKIVPPTQGEGLGSQRVKASSLPLVGETMLEHGEELPVVVREENPIVELNDGIVDALGAFGDDVTMEMPPEWREESVFGSLVEDRSPSEPMQPVFEPVPAKVEPTPVPQSIASPAPKKEPAPVQPEPAPEVIQPEIVLIPIPVPVPAPVPEPIQVPPIPPEQPVQIACPGKPYTVRRGDSFQLIARRFDVSMRALLEANPELQPGRLMVGDVLCIPQAAAPEPAPTPAPVPVPEPTPAPIPSPVPAREECRRVREGVSIADILLAGNVSLCAFQAANPGLRIGYQRVGDMVRIPPPGTRGACAEGLPNVVREGEDIAAFAVRMGVTVGTLLRANAHLLPTDFRAGQVVCVPSR